MSLLNLLFGNKSKNIKKLSSTEFKDAISNTKKLQLVDVRSPQEYKTGAIKNAINIDFYQPEIFEIEFNKLDKEKPVYIYCRSGARSGKAAKTLDNLGFKEIYDLRGGFMA
ncbi:rhodanese-like domain-containing protein [Cellulophaga baltica]|uniref:rhodanese-like domain-containing protein n=1 Tax=Cellulophaga TaxID=104264 RepID=UPI001C075D1A|nr:MULTISPECIES: rhodanese-like domain-containing protein [Cellulophaga]MBU2995409.1 rhodanese-like domain-containing protein [Cellulophaga baltica]MDO6766803.1 rhodanese-like domain-containing protein [Cellulophaga sp. 1_MG-2023]